MKIIKTLLKVILYFLAFAGFIVFAAWTILSTVIESSSDTTPAPPTVFEVKNINFAKDFKQPSMSVYGSYEIKNNDVIYHYTYRTGISFYMDVVAAERKVKKADVKTFKEIEKRYAVDKKRVYYKGKRLRKRDPKSFQVIDTYLTADRYGVYINDKIIKGSHGPSFKFKSRDYAMDNQQIYFIEGRSYRRNKTIDHESFVVLEENYAQDKDHVYFELDEIKGANVKHLKLAKYSDFSQDDKQIFWKSVAVKKADYASFRLFGLDERIKFDYLAEDKNYVYIRDFDATNDMRMIKKEKPDSHSK